MSPAVGGQLAAAQPVSRLDPINPQEGIFFGWSVAIDVGEQWLAISAPSAGSPVTAGRVDLYEATEEGWLYFTSLTGSDAVEGDDFGSSLTFSSTENGLYLLVGARDHGAAGPGEGAVFIFREIDGAWEESAKLLPPDDDAGDAFGRSIDADGPRVIVGAHYWNASGDTDRGAAYIYEFDGDTFAHRSTLTADVAEGDYFGESVAVYGDRAFVGAYRHDVGAASSAGAVFTYERLSANEWSFPQRITADEPGEGAGFGISLDVATLGAPTLAVGAYQDDDGRGRVLVFELEEDTWTERANLQAGDRAEGDWFGNSVSLITDPNLSGQGILAVGARRKDIGEDSRAGSAYRFHGSGSAWSEMMQFQPADAGPFSEVGYSVALGSSQMIVGAPYTPNAGQIGAVYAVPFEGVEENRPPVARMDWGFGTSQDPILIDVLANDSDADGDALSVASVGAPSLGTVEIVENRVVYTPDEGAEGDDSFGYIVEDGRGGLNEGSVRIRLGDPEMLMFVSVDEERESRDPEVFRTRRGNMNTSWMLGQQASDIEMLVLNLFDDVSLVAEQARVEQTGETSYSWFGIGPRQGDQVVLDIDTQMRSVLGTIWINGAPYAIRRIEGDLYTISEINSGAFIDEASVDGEAPEDGDGRGFKLVDDSFMDHRSDRRAAGKEQTSNIDVLVFYTTQAEDSAGGSAAMRAQIRNAVDLTNQTFRNSAIDARVRLVGTGRVQYDETGESSKDLGNLKSDGQSSGSDIYERRHDTQADIVGLVVGDFDACGRAYLMSEVDIKHRRKAYFVVQEGFCLGGNLSFGHEIGHIMGADHDRYVDPDEGPFDYSHGFVNSPAGWSSKADQWRSVMAYDDRCEEWSLPLTFSPRVDKNGNITCTRQMFWSDPDSLWNGVSRGVASGSNAADNVRALNNTASTAASFMSSEPAISGYITDAATGQPLDSAAVLLSDGQFIYRDSTDSEGFFVLFPTIVLSGATSVTVTPEFDDYVFVPESRTFSNINDDQSGNFTGFELFTAEGQVTFQPTGASMSGIELRGVTGVDETTDASGRYSFELPWGWSGRITPYSREYHFTPEALVIDSIRADTLHDFLAERNRYTIDGFVRELGGTPVPSVELKGFPSPIFTNSGGYYEIELEHGWEGTVTPVKPGYDFVPFDNDYDLIADRTDNYDAYPGVLARSVWPAFGADARNTAAVTASSVQDQVDWSATLNGRVASPVLAADGTAIVGTEDGWLIGFGPTGSRRWELDPSNFISISASPVVGTGGVVYVAESDASGRLTALNYIDRTVEWQMTTGAAVVAAPTIDSLGSIVVATTGGELVKVSPAGTRISTVTVDGPVYSSPAVADGNTTYFGSDDGRLYAYEGGIRRWSFTTGDQVRSGPAVASDGTIYFGSDDDHVYAVRPDGSEAWRVQTGGNVRSSPAIDSQGNIYVGSEDSLLYALDQAGQTLWTFHATAPISGSPVISQVKVRRFTQQLDEEILYFADDAGNLHALNLIALSPSSDRLKWQYVGAAPFGSSDPILTGDRLLIGSRSDPGRLTAFKPQSQAWTQGVILIQDAVLTQREVAIAIWQSERGGPLGIIGGLPDDDPCGGGPLIIPRCEFEGMGSLGDISPYVLVAANQDLVVGLIDLTADIEAVVSGETTEGLLATFPVEFEDGEIKPLVVGGLLDPERFAENPDGRPTGLDVYPLPYLASQPDDTEQVAVVAGHFSTDAGEIDVTMEGPVQDSFTGLRYGEISEVRLVPPGVYEVAVELSDLSGKRSVVASKTLDLSDKAGEVVSVLASGFANPDANQDGPALDLVTAGVDEVLQPVPIVEEAPELPSELKVLEAYPDPFSDATTIRYSLPETDQVSIEVFDVQGRLVRTLADRIQEAGDHSIHFQRHDLPSGLYFYRIRTTDDAGTGRMIVVR